MQFSTSIRSICKTAFALLLTIPASAQAPTFTNSNLPTPGLVTQFYQCDPTGVTQGTAGANQTWNFNLTPNSPLYSTTYLNPSSTPYASSFPTATVAKESNGTYDYYALDGTSYTWLGQSDGNTQVFSNAYQLYQLPLSYLGSYTDNYDITYVSGAPESGTSTVIYDGYGKLILNGDTVSQTMRTHRTEDYTAYDQWSGNPIGSGTVDSYIWCVPGSPQQLLLIAFSTYNGSQQTPFVAFDPNIPTSAPNVYNDNFDAWINSGNGDLVVLSNVFERAELQVIDATGRTCYVKNLELVAGQNNIPLSIKMLPAGFYLVKVTPRDQLSRVLKLTVQD